MTEVKVQTKPSSSRHRYTPMLLAIFTCTIFTVFSFIELRKWEYDRTTTEFERRAGNLVVALRNGIHHHIEAINSLVLFYGGSHNVERSEFMTFATGEVNDRMGFNALVWIPRVFRSELDTYEQEALNDGLGDFRITELSDNGNLIPVGDRHVYYPIFYTEPQEENESILGLDLGSIPDIVMELVEARDAGHFVATVYPILPDETDDAYCFTIFQPVYVEDPDSDSIEDRREKLEGFIAGFFNMDLLFQGSIEGLDLGEINIDIWDACYDERALYKSTSGEPKSYLPVEDTETLTNRLHKVETIDFGECHWTLLIYPNDEFYQSNRFYSARGVLVAGLVLTLLLAAYLLTSVGRTAQIQRVVDQRTNDLEREMAKVIQAEEALENQNEELQRSVADRDIAVVMAKEAQAATLNLLDDANVQAVDLMNLNDNLEETSRRLAEQRSRLQTIFEASPQGIFLIDIETREIVRTNSTGQKMLGRDMDQIIGKNCHLCIYGCESDSCPIFDLGKDEAIFESSITKNDGSVIHVIENSTKITIDGKPHILDVFTDITDRKLTEKTLKFRLELEEFIAEASSDFISLPTDSIDTNISNALEVLGVLTSADRTYLFLLSDDGKMMDNTHEWCADRVEPNIDNLKGIVLDDELPWFAGIIRKHEVIHVPDVNDLPPEAAKEKEHFEEQDIKSLIVVPMVSRGSLVGFVGLDSVREKHTWSDVLVITLGFIGDVFVNALDRKQSEERIAKVNACLANLGNDYNENINRLTALCGELLGASFAMYSHLAGETLCPQGQWKITPDFIPVENPDGNICYDVISQASRDALVIRNLKDSKYYDTNPNIEKFSLKTYIGHAVSSGKNCIGSLCVAFQIDFSPGDDELKLMGIIASAIGSEEDRKQAEDALIKSEEAYRLLADNATDTIWTSDLQMNMTYMSPSVLQQRGYTPEEALKQTIDQILTPASMNLATKTLMEALAAEAKEPGIIQRKVIEVEAYCRDGSTKWTEVNISFLRDDNGNPVGLLGISRDISDRKKAEDELRKFKTISDRASYGAMITIIDGTIIYVNEALAKMFGYSQEILRGKNMRMLCSDEQAEEYERIFNRIIREGSVVAEETWNTRRYGNPFPILLNASVINDDEGNPQYIAATSTDITKLKLTERELRLQKELAENTLLELGETNRNLEITISRANLLADKARDAVRAKGEFLANMSHEIRTPLNAIIGVNDLLHKTELTEQQDEYLSIARSSADNLLALINDILDFTKIEAGKLTLETIEFSAKETMDGITSMFSPLLHESELILTLNIAPEVPDIIIGDPVRLRQVLINLVSNAIKFTDEGEVLINIDVVNQTNEQVVLRFTVSDTGIGIPPEKLGTIFEGFVQADGTTTRKFGGSGLGLAIAKRIADSMGGDINVESTVGVGSTFTFTAPFGCDLDSLTSLQQFDNNLEPESDQHGSSRDMKVLIAEDNPVNQKVAESMLGQLGYKYDTVSNGHQALLALERTEYDIVLMDVQMPEMDGLEATRAIRLNPRYLNLPIIALTAHALAGDKERCIEAGMDDYLSKPVKIKDLRRIINKWQAGRKIDMDSDSLLAENAKVDFSGTLDIRKALKQIGSDKDLLREVFDLYLDDAPNKLRELRNALDANDTEGVLRAAHSLKGSSATIAADSVRKIALEIEQIAREDDLEPVRMIMDNLENELKKLKTAIDTAVNAL